MGRCGGQDVASLAWSHLIRAVPGDVAQSASTLLRLRELCESNSQISVVELSVNILQEDVTDNPESCWT